MNHDDIRSFGWYRGGIPWLQTRTIFMTVHGSQSYGTSTPESDTDVKGIAIAPREYYLGSLNHFEVQDSTKAPGGIDYSIYDIKFFFGLAMKCNPSIIEVLFTDPEHWLVPDETAQKSHHSWAWTRIHDRRRDFLSTQARHTFSGYAFDQLKRIRTHRGFLLNPPKAAPVRSEFGLPEGRSTIDKDQLGVIEARIRKHADTLGGRGLSKNLIEAVDADLVEKVVSENNLAAELIPIIIAERKFGAACKTWTQYQNHIKTRNPKRAELEEKFGYDTKHGMHLVRLLRMAREILERGEVIVKRPDAEELLAIRNGAWSFDKLVEWGTAEEAALPGLEKTSPLPHSPDRGALDRLLVDIVSEALSIDSLLEQK